MELNLQDIPTRVLQDLADSKQVAFTFGTAVLATPGENWFCSDIVMRVLPASEAVRFENQNDKGNFFLIKLDDLESASTILKQSIHERMLIIEEIERREALQPPYSKN